MFTIKPFITFLSCLRSSRYPLKLLLSSQLRSELMKLALVPNPCPWNRKAWANLPNSVDGAWQRSSFSVGPKTLCYYTNKTLVNLLTMNL